MAEKELPLKKISMTNTKQEMLKAYNRLLKELQEKKEVELKPEKQLEEKKKKEVVQVADSLSSEGVVKGISNLKVEIGKMLTQISDKLDEEVNKFRGIQKAIAFKEKELEEVYGIERSAATFAALIESQNQKRLELESEMAMRREELKKEIETIRTDWYKEKKDHEARVKEQEAEEQKRRKREKEEFTYAFDREKQLAKEGFEDAKAKLERDITFKKEQMEREWVEREKAVAAREQELTELQNRVNTFPKEMEAAANKAVKETTDRLKGEAESREKLLQKEFDGERNVLNTKINSAEKTVKEQGEQVAKLSLQMEKAYQKVQDIAVKAIEGSSNAKSLANLQQFLNEQMRKQPQEK
jgi:hypothetical protein